MDQTILKNISNPRIREKYQKYLNLPSNLRRQFFNPQTAIRIKQAGEKNNLNSSQTSESAYLTGAILLGEINITEFVGQLMQKCQLSRQAARQLARDINQIIFLPVKDELKKIHRIEYWPRENEVNKVVLSYDPARHLVNLKNRIK